MYANCDENDEISGETLRDIVGFVFQALGLSLKESADTEGNATPEDAFLKYCATLNRQLGGYDPYERCKEISTTAEKSVSSEIRDLIPSEQYTAKFDNLITSAVKSAKKVNALQHIVHAGHLIFRWDTKEESSSCFTVVKIFRSGANLEIIPTYMSITSRKDVAGLLVFRSTKEVTTINFKQRKYYLTKFDIEAIIPKLKKMAHSRW